MNFTPRFKKRTSKIIALDDDPIFGMLLNKHFEHFSQEMSANGAILDYKIARTSREGLRDFDETCNVMILDYSLDELDDSDITGLDILDEVKILSPNTKVLVVSGKRETSIKNEFLAHGAIEFMEKDTNTIARIMNFLHHELAA
jgi:DNA-binding NtrC family response regulator